MDSDSRLRDVIVIGGGPAGSTAAALLARRGHDVLLLEKEKFPREHVGESLLPFSFTLLRDLGVLEEMESRFVRKPGVRFVDRYGKAATTWCFGHVIEDPSYLSFQVIRGEFDQVLLENARELGAEVREQVRVTETDLTDPDRVRVEAVAEDGRKQTHNARFLIDASGRDAFVGARNGWRKPREELDRTAIWSHWRVKELAGGLEEGLSMILYMGEEKKGWIWVFPLGRDRVTAGVVMQNSYMREQRKLLEAAGQSDWKQALMMQELEQSPFVSKLLDGAPQIMPVQVNGDYSYEVTNHFGTNYAMIGDARGFIDPIFSSGVFLSMKTAFLVTDAVHTKFTESDVSGSEQMVRAYELVTGAYKFVHRMIRLFYNPHATSWAEVGEGGEVHRRHQSAMAAGHFVLSGDFFENQAKYNTFFDMLEDPRKFQVCKRLVIDRPGFNRQSCETPLDLVFGRMDAWDERRHAASSVS